MHAKDSHGAHRTVQQVTYTNMKYASTATPSTMR